VKLREKEGEVEGVKVTEGGWEIFCRQGKKTAGVYSARKSLAGNGAKGRMTKEEEKKGSWGVGETEVQPKKNIGGDGSGVRRRR